MVGERYDRSVSGYVPLRGSPADFSRLSTTRDQKINNEIKPFLSLPPQTNSRSSSTSIVANRTLSFIVIHYRYPLTENQIHISATLSHMIRTFSRTKPVAQHRTSLLLQSHSLNSRTAISALIQMQRPTVTYSSNIAPQVTHSSTASSTPINSPFPDPDLQPQHYIRETMSKVHKISKNLKKQKKYHTFPIINQSIAELPKDQKAFLLEELGKFVESPILESLNIYRLLTNDNKDHIPNIPHGDLLDLINVFHQPATFAYYMKLFEVLQDGKGELLFSEKIYEASVRKEVLNFKVMMKDIIAKVSAEIDFQSKKPEENSEALLELQNILTFYETKGGLVDMAGNVLEKPDGQKYNVERLCKLQPDFVSRLEATNLKVEAYTAKQNKTLKKLLREHPNNREIERIINKRLVEEFGFDGCFDPLMAEQIRASDEQSNLANGGKRAQALDKTKVKKLCPLIFKPNYDYPLQTPSLQQAIPQIDSSIYETDFLRTITDYKLKNLQDYLNEVNTTRKKHLTLHNDPTFTGLTECLRMGTSLMDTFISIDIEAFEFSQQKITEIGISIYDPLKESLSVAPNFINIHILIKEHLHLRNGKYVVDNKDKYLCGNSIILTRNEALKFIQSLLDHYLIRRYETHGMNSILVGHDIKGDIKWLKQLGLHLPSNVKSLDSQIISKLANGSTQLGLGKILNRYGIPHGYLHNAGNDAYFTLILLLKLVDVNFRKTHKIDVPVNNYKPIEDVKQSPVSPGNDNLKKMKKAHKIFEFSEPKGYHGYIDALRGIYKED